MLIKGNMTIDYLIRKQVISKRLYRFLESYSVKTLDEAIQLREWVVFSEPLLEELNDLKCDIEKKIKLLKEGIIANIYYGGIISKRLYKNLQNLGFTVIPQLFQYILNNGGESNALLTLNSLGKASVDEVDEIIDFFKYYNYDISEIVSDFESTQCKDIKAHITTSTKIIKLHEQELMSVRLFNCLYHTLELYTIGDIIDYIKEAGSIDTLLSVRNFGRKTLTELEELLVNVEESYETLPDLEIQEESPKDLFFASYNELIKIKKYNDIIKCYYESTKAKLSTRAINVLVANFTSIEEILVLYFDGLDISRLWSCGKKTYEELEKFIINFYNYVSSLVNSDEDYVDLMLIGDTYPFLGQNEIEFVGDFKKRHLHVPMFYILYHYLVKSESHFEKLFCRYYGVGRAPETLKDISVDVNLTRERCRQLIAKNNLQRKPLATSDEWNHYKCLDDILLYNTYDYKGLLCDEELEHLSMFSFIGLCSLVKDIRICKIGRSGSTSYKEYYISGALDDSFDLKNSIKDIESTLNKRCTEDVKLPITAFIDSYWLKEPLFDKSKVEDIIIYIIKEDYGIELDEDRVLYIQQNAIDRSGEIYKIIEEHGKPMHINQIREAIISRYPDDLSDLTIEQVRSDMYKHPHIKSLGKLSTYAIDKWELYTGTIRDLLYDILSLEKEPMHIEELYNEVSLIYPNTSIKSITSSMVSDNLQRFVRFVGSYYGVTGKSYDEEYVLWDAEAFSRKNFDERIVEFEVFLKSHHHLPRHSEDNDEEAAHCRWYKRVKASDASISAEQQKRLSDLLERYSDYLVTATEYSFYRYCEEFKAFIEDNMEFPTLETDSAKYGWFSKHKKHYMDYEDRRKIYFEELIDFLYTYGFEV